ncbi:MAG: exonuclease SbcCD subunit D [Candidatus Woesearchaeota archaeon]
MKFAHFADLHLGSWRDQRIAGISTKAFLQALEICKSEKVDFILISGDMFNTSLPSIDCLKDVVSALKNLKDSNIPVYIIAGSHDFSPTGKTMLDVLENAGLLANVMRGEVIDNKLKLKFTIDSKTGAKITGIIGKKGMLGKAYYENLAKDNLESEEGFKIFMFHTSLSEFKPAELEKMESQPLSLLPKGFDYYAGGHVHYVFSKREPGYGLIAYPGPIFPNNVAEIEKLKYGGFYIVEASGKDIKCRHILLRIYSVVSFCFDCDHKNASDVEERAVASLKSSDLHGSIVTMRFWGKLKSGKPSDINFNAIVNFCYNNGAYFVMRNSSALTAEEFEEIKTGASTVEGIEQSVISEHIGQIRCFSPEKEAETASVLLSALNIEKEEGETTSDFEKRVRDDVSRLLGIELS